MSLFGPILRFELVRIARRQRVTSGRCMFALVLAGLAGFVYYLAHKESRGPMSMNTLARVTEGIILGLFVLLFGVAGLFTPQLTGDAISGEKERRTLPFLLLTDLTSREIILGKLASRLIQIGLLLLAALPVLVGLQFFGGVEPLLILLAATGLAATVWSVGSLSMLCSVYARTPRAAAQRTGQILAAYIFGLMAGRTLIGIWPWVGMWPGMGFSIGDLLDWLNLGNPIRVFDEIRIRGGSVVSAIGAYIAFHFAVGAAFVLWAIARLRPVAATLTLEGAPPEKRGPAPRRRRPPIGNRPVLWKMLHCDFRPYKTTLGRLTIRVAYWLSFTPVLFLLGIAYTVGRGRGIAETMMGFNRTIGTMMLCALIVHVAAQAASSIGRERTKQTLDDLLLTDLSPKEILAQKWWGSILTMRPMLLWIAFQWFIAVVTSGMHLAAVPVVAVLWMTYVAFAASLGMYYAARMPTAQKATLWTSMVGFIVAVAPLALALISAWQYPQSYTSATLAAISPPAALGIGGFDGREFGYYMGGRGAASIHAMVVGMAASAVIFSALALIFWRGACRWLPRTIGR